MIPEFRQRINHRIHGKTFLQEETEGTELTTISPLTPFFPVKTRGP
jgi:hypothetical protein